MRQTMIGRSVERSLVLLALTWIGAGCTTSPRVEVEVNPTVACPGDIVRFTVRSLEGHSHGRLTISPAPLEGYAVHEYDETADPLAASHEVQICQSTGFDAVFWRGSETLCGENYTTCVPATVEVAVGEQQFDATLDTCEESGEITFPAATTAPLRVREIANCTAGGREVEITSPIGTRADLAAGPPTPAFAGESLVGTWRVRREVMGDEGCPPDRPLDLDQVPDIPPTICLRITAACDESPACG